MKKILLIVSVALFFFAAGCTSSRITSHWKADNVIPKKYNKILVMGLIREDDRSLQEQMEDHLVGDLKDQGYNAVSAYREYGPKAFEKMDETNALAKIKDEGVDAVMTIVLLNKEKERYYVPGHVQYSPFIYYHRRLWGYYSTMYTRIYTPGYYATNTKYFWESNLYDMTSKELVYSVQTQSFNPSSSGTLAHEYGKMIVNNMVEQNVLIK